MKTLLLDVLEIGLFLDYILDNNKFLFILPCIHPCVQRTWGHVSPFFFFMHFIQMVMLSNLNFLGSTTFLNACYKHIKHWGEEHLV